MILIVTRSEDPTADFVIERLKERAVKFQRLDVDLIYGQGRVSLSPERNSWLILMGDTQIRSEEIGVVWERRLPKPEFKHENKYAEEYLNQEWRLFWEWWVNALPLARILDPEWKLKRAVNKFAQMVVAQEVGLRTPETLVTNDSQELQRFIDFHNQVVAKTMGGFARITDEVRCVSRVVYTSRLTPQELAHLDTIKYAPAIFQREVEKDYELRVTLVGDQLFTCKIESQRSPRTNVDWRRYDFPNVPHSATELPPKVGEKLIKMAKVFEIHFASFDLAVTPEGEYVFFEMNPNSQWVWIEELTGLPITDALIDLLKERARQ